MLCPGPSSTAADAPAPSLLDDAGDAVIRRTDPGNNGPISDSANLADLLSVTLGGWDATDAYVDPFTGTWIEPGTPADLLRIDIRFNTLVNPPGRLGIEDDDYEPFLYGDSPILGFLEVDVDANIDTGGQLGASAEDRWLASVARFGGLPVGDYLDRAAVSAKDYDGDFFIPPYIERTGEDFSVVLCGCFPITIIDDGNDPDGRFTAGDTWVVRGRFFPRAAGYAGASGVFGGSDLGQYDPEIDIRFSHDVQHDVTTVTVVYPLTQIGAAELIGDATVELPDGDVSNQFSMEEAIRDLIISAMNSSLPDEERILIEDWGDFIPPDAPQFLEPSDWTVRAIFGVPYETREPAFVVWTDEAGDFTKGDLDGSGCTNESDRAIVEDYIESLDGTIDDDDGMVNGEVTIVDFGVNFHAADINGDGALDQLDLDFYTPPIPGDADGDGDVDMSDLGIVLASYDLFLGDPFYDPRADFNGDDAVNIEDLGILLANFGYGVEP
jgi:hypothetical protein